MKIYRLLFIIGVVFIISRGWEIPQNTSLLVKSGGSFSPLIRNGEYFRLFSAVFLHIGFAHLIMNSISLFFLGKILDELYDFGDVFGVFIISGIVGNLVSMYGSEIRVSAGASGGICGLLGLYLLFWFKYRYLFDEETVKQQIKEVGWIILINAIYGGTVSNVDNLAHIGGGVTGFLGGMFICSKFDPINYIPQNKKRASLIAVFGVVISVIGTVWAVSVSYKVEAGDYVPQLKTVKFGNKEILIPSFWTIIQSDKKSLLMRDEMGLGAHFFSFEPPVYYEEEREFNEYLVQKRYDLLPVNFKRDVIELTPQKKLVILEFDGNFKFSPDVSQHFYSVFYCENNEVKAILAFFYVSDYVWVKELLFFKLCRSIRETID